MAKQLLDKDLVDMELSEEVVSSIARAQARGSSAPAIVGALFGAAVSIGRDDGATLDDLHEVVTTAWGQVDEVRNETHPNLKLVE